MWLLYVMLAAIAALIYKSWYDSTEHISMSEVSELRPDASPCKVERKEIGLKGEHKYRTIVTFDDGFRYISHKTNRENHFLSYSISVPRSMNAEILSDAVAAHKKACNKPKRL